eukprot:Pgem_evm1s13469
MKFFLVVAAFAAFAQSKIHRVKLSKHEMTPRETYKATFERFQDNKYFNQFVEENKEEHDRVLNQ